MKNYFLLFIFLLFSLNITAQNYHIYISDAGNFSNPPWQILKFQSDGSNPQVFINTNLNWPQDILFLEDKNEVLISNLNTNSITRYNATTGQYIDNFVTGIGGPTRMKIGPDSLIYVLQWFGNGKVLRYDFNGMFIDEFTTTGVAKSIGIDWDSDKNLYVSSYTGNLVQKFDSSGNDLGVFINSNLNGPTNIWYADDTLYVVEYNAGNVKTFDMAGNYLGIFITGLNAPEGVAFLPTGNLLIGDGGTASVKEFTSGGTLVGSLISSGSGNLIQPNAVVLRYTSTTSITENPDNILQVIPTYGREFKFKMNNNRECYISIFNINGQKVYENKYNNQFTWNAEKINSGIYFVKGLTENGDLFFKKIIVGD